MYLFGFRFLLCLRGLESLRLVTHANWDNFWGETMGLRGGGKRMQPPVLMFESACGPVALSDPVLMPFSGSMCGRQHRWPWQPEPWARAAQEPPRDRLCARTAPSCASGLGGPCNVQWRWQVPSLSMAQHRIPPTLAYQIQPTPAVSPWRAGASVPSLIPHFPKQLTWRAMANWVILQSWFALSGTKLIISPIMWH